MRWMATVVGMALLAGCSGDWLEARKGVVVETWSCADDWLAIPLDGRFPVAKFCDEGTCGPAYVHFCDEDWWETDICDYGGQSAEVVVAALPFAPDEYELGIATVKAEPGIPLHIPCAVYGDDLDCAALLGRTNEDGDLVTGNEGTWVSGYQLVEWSESGVVQHPSCEELEAGLEPLGEVPLVYLCDDGDQQTGCSQEWAWEIVDGLFTNRCGSSNHPDIVVHWFG